MATMKKKAPKKPAKPKAKKGMKPGPRAGNPAEMRGRRGMMY